MAFDDTKMDSFGLIGIVTILIPVCFVMRQQGLVSGSWVGFGLGAGLLGYAWWIGRPWHRRQ